MTQSELMALLAQRFPALTAGDVEFAVSEIILEIKDTLIRGCRIEIRGFGCFDLKYRAPRKARNPKTGKPVFVGAKRVIHFKPGKEMRERVERSVQPEQVKMAA